jgi:hypothetical protein
MYGQRTKNYKEALSVLALDVMSFPELSRLSSLLYIWINSTKHARTQAEGFTRKHGVGCSHNGIGRVGIGRAIKILQQGSIVVDVVASAVELIGLRFEQWSNKTPKHFVIGLTPEKTHCFEKQWRGHVFHASQIS